MSTAPDQMRPWQQSVMNNHARDQRRIKQEHKRDSVCSIISISYPTDSSKETCVTKLVVTGMNNQALCATHLAPH
jgi:hypothetical protein